MLARLSWAATLINKTSFGTALLREECCPRCWPGRLASLAGSVNTPRPFGAVDSAWTLCRLFGFAHALMCLNPRSTLRRRSRRLCVVTVVHPRFCNGLQNWRLRLCRHGKLDGMLSTRCSAFLVIRRPIVFPCKRPCCKRLTVISCFAWCVQFDHVL